jgi:hypothetical protein
MGSIFTPSFRFPLQAGRTEPFWFPSRSRGNLQAGETEPLRGSPREAGGTWQANLTAWVPLTPWGEPAGLKG